MKRKIKIIKMDLDKCMGCRACEVACSAFHANPKYSSVNPSKSRIRVFRDDQRNVFVPVRATFYTKAECEGRSIYIANGEMQSVYGKDYVVCSFCGAACPARDLFKDPDSGLPLKCDVCENEPPLEEPWCVQVCLVDALTYEEREEEVEEEPPKENELEVGLNALADRFGFDKVVDMVIQMATAKKAQEIRK